jgi:hypothetical protein
MRQWSAQHARLACRHCCSQLPRPMPALPANERYHTHLPCCCDGRHCSIIDGLHVCLCEACKHWAAQHICAQVLGLGLKAASRHRLLSC